MGDIAFLSSSFGSNIAVVEIYFSNSLCSCVTWIISLNFKSPRHHAVTEKTLKVAGSRIQLDT